MESHTVTFLFYLTYLVTLGIIYIEIRGIGGIHMIEQGFLIMLSGMGGIFLVMGIIYIIIKLLNYFAKS